MTSTDAEVVRASLDAFNRRDVPEFLRCIDENVEWVPLNAVLDGDVYRGHDGIHRFLHDVDEDIEGMQVRTDELRECNGSVVLLGSITGKGRASCMDLEMPTGWVIRVEGDRVVYLRAYSTLDAALEAAETLR